MHYDGNMFIKQTYGNKNVFLINAYFTKQFND